MFSAFLKCWHTIMFIAVRELEVRELCINRETKGVRKNNTLEIFVT